MRYIIGFILILILSVIFSYFQGFIDFLINLGVFPEKYKNSANFDIMMIVVLYLIFMTTAFIIGGTVIVFFWMLDWKLARKYKRAKKRAQNEFGTTSPYFYFMEPNINAPAINADKSYYVYEVYRDFLYQKYNDWDKALEMAGKVSNIESLEIYHEAIEYFGLPDISREYGIFNAYTDEELARFNK